MRVLELSVLQIFKNHDSDCLQDHELNLKIRKLRNGFQMFFKFCFFFLIMKTLIFYGFHSEMYP